MLPADAVESYVRAIGLSMNGGGKLVLPQWFADRFGWEEMTATVAEVYQSRRRKSQVATLARNYGEADAINFFGDEYGLPRAISGHNNHYLWGPGDASGEVVIAFGSDGQLLRRRPAAYESFLRERGERGASGDVYL
jgi:hypothetical protein